MKIIRYIQSFGLAISCLFFSLSFVFTSCVDEEIIEREKEDKPTEEEPIDGYSIGFKIQLDKDMSGKTRGPEDYDNYIDTRDKFRVLFFTKEGQFLFGAVDRTVTPLSDQSGSGVATWYVRVPVNYIVDRDGNQFDADVIKKYLKENDFKVAILANWPNDAVMESDGGDDETVNTPEWTYIHREPNWGWEQSILNAESNDVKNINDLHHLVVDAFYNDNSTSNNRPSRRQVYDFVMDGNVSGGEGTMGVKTDWVKMRNIEEGFNGSYDGTFEDQQSAETWIRQNWDPSKKKNDINNDHVYRDYSNIWQLWNFSGGNYVNSYNELMVDRKNNTIGVPENIKTAWRERNGYSLSQEMTANNVYLSNYWDINGLIFQPSTNSGNLCYSYHYGNNYRGIVLKPAEVLGGSVGTNNSYIDEDKTTPSRGFLKFTAYSTGTYRIKYGSLYGESTMVIQHNSNIDKTFTVSGAAPQSMSYSSNNETLYYRDLSITGDPETIYIWNGNGQGNKTTGDLIIYSIEWISSKYLYDTDRIGVEPSEDNPIPMYGVQNFTKLGDNWEEGTTFDISAARDQEDIKPISLIRSLAKVEVYLPNKAKHIYMRSMNRTARCEPIDVETPTNELWSSDHSPGQCEWFNVQTYGTGYKYFDGDPPSKNADQLNDYTNWLSWFYGSWRYNDNGQEKNGNVWKWDFNSHNGGVNVNVPKPDNNKIPSYPHLFYPDINRSDFCHMLYMGYEEGKGYKYILYMPDKNITDPNYVGFQQSIAKVPHIEYRYDDNTNNLEDNNCYRIYFTNYNSSGVNLGPYNPFIANVKPTEYEPRYERNQKESNDWWGTTIIEEDHLSYHWPIMRNHIYEFIVRSDAAHYGEPIIQAKVKEWGYDRVVVEW